jgi:hypothetical protein
MARRIALGGLALVVLTVIVFGARGELLAQAPAAARAETGDAAIAALVAEVRALRADLAAASRNQLRAQLLLGRVQMQEQRLAYLDKQRADTAAALAAQTQMTAMFGAGMPGPNEDPCATMPGGAEARRDCVANFTQKRQQVEELRAREAQLRAQESELANALSAEQARWSEFNSRLDELERTIR